MVSQPSMDDREIPSEGKWVRTPDLWNDSTKIKLKSGQHRLNLTLMTETISFKENGAIDD